MLIPKHSDMPKTEPEMTALGLEPLGADALYQRLIGKTFAALFPPVFVYVIRFDTDGSLWGRNNAGTEDRGQWRLDRETGYLNADWQSYWGNRVVRVYAQGGVTHLFDTSNGHWRTSLFQELMPDDDMAVIRTPPWFG